jgi:hypothetical protein
MDGMNIACHIVERQAPEAWKAASATVPFGPLCLPLFGTIGVLLMARFDFRNNDYEWGFTFQMGGHSLFFESTPSPASPARTESAWLDKAKPVPKKLTRKIRKFPVRPNVL